MATTITVEIELDGVWTDISLYVRYESRITVTRGRSDEASQADPVTCGFTVNNRDGRFSPRNPSGAYFGQIGRNTPVRVSKTVDAVQYFRFYGEISDWPVQWDISGTDVYVPIKASGVFRRLQQGSPPTPSSMFREFTNPERTHIIAYWPCEDATGSATIASGLAGMPAMQITGAPELASNSQWTASSALPVMRTGTFTGRINAATATDDVRVQFFLFVDDAVSANTNLFTLRTSGTAPVWDVQLTTSGGLRTRAYESETETGTALVDDTTAFSLNSAGFCLVSLWLSKNGTGIDWSTIVEDFDNNDVIDLDTLDLTDASGTLSNRTIGRPVAVSVNTGGGLGNVIVGHIAVADSGTAFDASDSATFAWNGEVPMDRVVRLCDEEGLASSVSDPDFDSVVTMGDQKPGTLLELLRQCGDTGQEILYETRDQLGVGYRNHLDLYNQTAALTLDYSAHELADALNPIDDDQAIVNDVTVTRIDGASARAELTEGPLSTQDPPDGAGRYADMVEISAQEDLMLADQAGWRLHLGTVDEARYPKLALQLAHDAFTSDADLMADALNLELGDRVVVENPPAWLPPDDISLLVQGYTETFDQFLHDITLNCSPESPWQVAVEGTDHYDTAGSTLAAATDEVAFVASAATLNSSSADSVTVSKPTGTLQGHVMLARIGLIGQVTITAPSGWTLVDTPEDAGSAVRYAAYYKVAGSSEPTSYTWTWTGNPFKNSGTIAAFSGVDTSSPIAASAGTATNVSGTAFATTAVTVPKGGILSVGVFERHAATGAANTWTDASDTERVDHGSNGGSGQDMSHAVYTSAVQTAETSISRTLTASQTVSQVATWAIALQPSSTSLSVATGTGPVWTQAAADLPFNIVVGGEEMTVTAVTGSTSPQTFTVTRSVNGVTKTHASGDAVSLYKKGVRAL